MRNRLWSLLIALSLAAGGPVWAGAAPVVRPPIVIQPEQMLAGEFTLEFGNPQTALLASGAITGFAFGPGRDEIAYCAQTDQGRWALYTIRARLSASGEARRVPDTSRRLVWTAPAGVELRGPIWWSPAGTQIALRAFRKGTAQALFSVDYATGQATEVASGLDIQEAAWSPDGGRVAVIERTEAGPKVCLLTFPRGGASCLADGARDLRWSVDGKTLHWLTRADAGWVESSWNAETGEVQDGRHLPGRPEGALLSPDGKLWAALDGDPKRLVVYPAAADAGETIALPGAPPHRLLGLANTVPVQLLGWSPDSRLVVLLDARRVPIAVSVKPRQEIRDDLLRELAKDGVTYEQLRASVLGPPVDPAAGAPSWSSQGDAVVYVWNGGRLGDFLNWTIYRGQRETSELADMEADYQARTPYWVTAKPTLIAVGVKRSYLEPVDSPQVQSEMLRGKLLTNIKNVAMALQMYITDTDGRFPDAATAVELRKILSGYLSEDSVWRAPDGDEIVVKYLLPPGTKVQDLADPVATPVAVIDLLPDYDAVGFADGHAKLFPKAAAEQWQSHIVSPPRG